MSGQNKRIYKRIKEINDLIKEYKLNYIRPIICLTEEGIRKDNEIKAKHVIVISDINRIIGELTSLSLPAANRTKQTK